MIYGSLFKNNDGKGKAVMSGDIEIDGTSYYMDVYLATEKGTDTPKLTKNGDKYYSLRLKVKGEAAPKPSGGGKPPIEDDFGDTIPF